MRRLIARLPALLLVLVGVNAVWAFSSGPPVSRTSAFALGIYPAEGNCTSCHSGNPLNDPNGGLQILDIPSHYSPGQTYPLRVRLSYSLADTTGPSNPKWGFELTVVKASDGTGVGTIVAPPAGPGPSYPDSLLIKTATAGVFATSGRQYIEQSTFSTRTDLPSPAEWTFNWVAPSTATGRIYFFANGNAANGNAQTSGDHIFVAADSSDAPQPVPASSATSRRVLAVALVLVGAGFVIVRRRWSTA
jgi:hypothetical protein